MDHAIYKEESVSSAEVLAIGVSVGIPYQKIWNEIAQLVHSV